MAKDKPGGKRGISATISTTQSTSSTQNTQAVTLNGSFDDNYAKQLRQKYDDNYDPDVVGAVKLYGSDRPGPNGFSISQNLNYALDNNLPLGVNEAFVDKYIGNGMHPIDTDAQFIRASHDDMLKGLGINDYSKMTEAQLTKKLVGGIVKSDAYMSFSYSEKDNVFIPGNKYAGTSKDRSGGREVIFKITHTNPQAKMVFGRQDQTEVIMNKGTQYKITKVYYNGQRAMPRLGGSKPVLVVEGEIL